MMPRVYGDDQRKASRDLLDDLVCKIEQVYLKAFEDLNNHGLGEGAIVRLTQHILISRDAAISALRKEIR